jgi:hypothetical protein
MYNRKQLRDAVAREFGLVEGPSTGGSYNTLEDSVRLIRYADDYFIGHELYIESTSTGVAPQGETSFIVDFVKTGGICTVSPLFTAPATDCDYYQIFRWVTKEDIDRALGDACAGVEIATNLTPKTDSVDYYVSNLPGLSRASQITGVWWRQSSTDMRYLPQPIGGCQFEDAEGQLVLRLPATLTATNLLWITYVGDGQYMQADTQYVNLPLPLIVARAVVTLIEPLMLQADANSAERWGASLRYWIEKLNRLERQRQPSASRSKSYTWVRASTNRADVALNLLPNF